MRFVVFSTSVLVLSNACAQRAAFESPDTVWGAPMSEAAVAPAPAPAPVEEAPKEAEKTVVEAEAKVEVPPPEPAFPKSFEDAARQIEAVSTGKRRAWDRLAYLSDFYAPRLSGSKTLEQAIDWSIKIMEEDGLASVRREKVMVPRWIRGEESARITAPIKRNFPILGLGMSVGTRGTLKGEIAVVSTLDEIDQRGDELKGKIVVINKAMPDFDHHHNDAGYSKTVVIRTSGASRASKYGAKAVLVRSVTANSLRTPHTGMLKYDENSKPIPAAAISPADAEFFVRMAERKETVKIELNMGAKQRPDVESANAIGEIRGSEKPEEIVVIGGHIDSWDVGDGSTDDGSGCLMAMEAAKLLMEAGLKPKRTIRVVLFTNEENGLRGGKAYAEQHANEVHVGGIESDAGSAAPRGFTVAGSTEQIAELQKYRPLLERFNAGIIEAGGGGADLSPMTEKGLLSIAVRPDGSHYFDLHHTHADTVEKIDPQHLQQNSAAMAMMAYILANRD